MKTLKAIASLLLIAGILFTLGCKKTTSNPPGGFSGTVTYSNAGVNTPASGAYVWLTAGSAAGSPDGSYKTYTDANGNYSFDNIPQGSYYVNGSYTDTHGYFYNSGGSVVSVNGSNWLNGVNFTLQ